MSIENLISLSGSVTGNLGPICTDVEATVRKSGRNLFISHSSPEHAARDLRIDLAEMRTAKFRYEASFTSSLPKRGRNRFDTGCSQRQCLGFVGPRSAG